MPTQFNFQSVLEAFRLPEGIVVQDVTCSLDAGVWIETPDATTRTEQAIVLTEKPLDTTLHREGNVYEGDLSVITNAELYVADNASSVGLTRQSYVMVHGERWKVMGHGMFLGNTGHRQYRCTRVVE